MKEQLDICDGKNYETMKACMYSVIFGACHATNNFFFAHVSMISQHWNTNAFYYTFNV